MTRLDRAMIAAAAHVPPALHHLRRRPGRRLSPVCVQLGAAARAGRLRRQRQQRRVCRGRRSARGDRRLSSGPGRACAAAGTHRTEWWRRPSSRWAKPASSSSPARPSPAAAPWCRPTSVSATRAWPSCSIRPTGATATRSSTAPTAARASASFGISPTTGPRPPWRPSSCAKLARLSTTTQPTAAFTPSPTPARSAGHRSGLSGRLPCLLVGAGTCRTCLTKVR